ncbi:PhzF family phenazine biosynthesis protein [Streptomyces sp. NPDC018031]|uniref:PhzF family phenazine biosynthesis protein n=1 Tax=Streptomyces sp. NPDC018031 TaxID=3365033 RepID=UPI0037B54995
MTGGGLPVAIVHACLRDGAGGSPTAVTYEASLSDDDRRRLPVVAGTSHAVFVSVADGRPGGPLVSLRFFTAEGELPACGHGTVAALAFLAARTGGEERRWTLRASGRVFTGRSARAGAYIEADFDAGPVRLRAPTAGERSGILSALGLPADPLAAGIRVASTGRPRVLVPVATRSALAALAPDLHRLRTTCDRFGLLGCYVHSVPTGTGRVAARMFAPSIGVPEDIANANSTACLAAHLSGHGPTGIVVDMGDSLHSPATITATARPGPAGPLVRLGGTARIVRTVRLP